MNEAYFTLNQNVDKTRNPDHETKHEDFRKSYNR